MKKKGAAQGGTQSGQNGGKNAAIMPPFPSPPFSPFIRFAFPSPLPPPSPLIAHRPVPLEGRRGAVAKKYIFLCPHFPSNAPSFPFKFGAFLFIDPIFHFNYFCAIYNFYLIFEQNFFHREAEMSHPHEDNELLEAAANSLGPTSPNWTELDCGWLEEVRHIQNHFYWRHTNPVLLLGLYAAVCSFGALANLFVLLSFIRVAQLRNLRNYFIVNLAFSDLLLCTITAPVTLYLSLNFFWPFGTPACQLVASIQAVNMFVSCLTLVLIAMDRFLLTLCPVKWRLAAKAPIICYLFVWVCSFIVAAPYGAAVSAEDATMLDPWNSPHVDDLLAICDMERPQICMEDVKSWTRLPFSRRTYTLTVLAIQYLLPLSALAVAYSQIGSTIHRRGKASTTVHGDRKQQMQRRNRKALALLLGLVLVYAVAWAPMNIYNVLHVLELIPFSQYQYLFCHLLGMVSASMNPLLYALINDSFRTAFLQLVQPLLQPCTLFNPFNRNRTTAVPNLPHETISSALLPQMTSRKTETPPTRRPPPEGLWVVNGTARRTLSPTADTGIGMAELSSVGGSPRENGPSEALAEELRGDSARQAPPSPAPPMMASEGGGIGGGDQRQRQGEEEDDEEEGQTTEV